MNRRRMIQGCTTATLAVTAGCLGPLSQSGEAEMEWEYEWGTIESNGQTGLIVTGEAENTGEVYVEEFDLECEVQTDDGETIESDTKTLEFIEEEETQMFFWQFEIPEAELATVDTVEVDGDPVE